jgi:AcrR family transcriptional regulator
MNERNDTGSPVDKDTAKDRILRSAKKEFSERGFSGARMSSIAKASSVNKALIHYYFKDKESLYLDVLTRIFRGSADTPVSFPDRIGRWELSPSQKLYVILYFTVNIFLKATDPEATRIIFWELAEGKRHLDRLVMEYSIPRQRIVADVVSEGIAKGEFETAYPMMAAMNVVSFIALYNLHRGICGNKPAFGELFGDVNDEDVLLFVLDHAFKSLAPSNGVTRIPELPAGLAEHLDAMIELLVEMKDEGVNEEFFRRVDSILHDTTNEGTT